MSFLIHSLICEFISLWAFGFLFYSVAIIHFCHYCDAQITWDLANGNPFILDLVLASYAFIIIWRLSFCCRQMPQTYHILIHIIILFISLLCVPFHNQPSLWRSPHSFKKKGNQKARYGTRCAHCYRYIMGYRAFQQTESGSVYANLTYT